MIEPSPDSLARIVRTLARRDPVLASVIRAHGPCLLHARRADPRFPGLIRTIVGQQLSARAAQTIYARLVETLGGAIPPPAVLRDTDPALLRSAGLSRAKAAAVLDLASRLADGALSLDSLDTLDDEAVVEALCTVKGIGRWSAEMFLMFRLGRLDVLPLGDVGIRRAVQRVYGFRRIPATRTLIRVAEPWRPWRSIACWYLWRVLDALPADAAPRGPQVVVGAGSPSGRRAAPRDASTAAATATMRARRSGPRTNPAR